ncbi:MAG: methyl-accepting chemotaxis protein, partial [Thermodesulfobacteriota bacterium]|nr:methyl-accepting chemotaxis protein [Thermodesulfobacteriota bacterium]
AVGFGLVIIVLIIVGTISFFRIRGIQSVVTGLSETHIPLAHAVSYIGASVTKQELASIRYAFHKDEKFLLMSEETHTLAEKKFEEVKVLVMGNQELVNKGWLEAIENLTVQYNIFIKSSKGFIEAVKRGKTFEELDSLADDISTHSRVFREHIDDFLNMNNQENQSVATSVINRTMSARWIIGIIVGIILTVSVLTAFFITRSVTQPINRIITGLNKSATHVASSSNQVSFASQSLANGASQQAASIEETSSSLVEMSSMTKKNAENAQQADKLMKEANQVVGRADNSMAELTTSMEEISKASEETSKIIKTIDEIAFQTNLLALNAAVEAARAGEAGAGFAVVADEVRNLAMRAAEAAKNTAELIEGTVKKIKEGSELVNTTSGAFSEVTGSTAKVGGLVGEIAAASNEQARGIEQVNLTVAEMDKVVQQNAAIAEESASASEEMNIQAKRMNSMVTELAALVGWSLRAVGGNKFSMKQQQRRMRKKTGDQNRENLRTHKDFTTSAKNNRAGKQGTHNSNIIQPEQVIPMNDGDFMDF